MADRVGRGREEEPSLSRLVDEESRSVLQSGTIGSYGWFEAMIVRTDGYREMATK